MLMAQFFSTCILYNNNNSLLTFCIHIICCISRNCLQSKLSDINNLLQGLSVNTNVSGSTIRWFNGAAAKVQVLTWCTPLKNIPYVIR